MNDANDTPPSIPDSPDQGGDRHPCPQCAELTLKTAKKCQFCGFAIESPAPPPSAPTQTATKGKPLLYIIYLVAVFGILAVVVYKFGGTANGASGTPDQDMIRRFAGSWHGTLLDHSRDMRKREWIVIVDAEKQKIAFGWPGKPEDTSVAAITGTKGPGKSGRCALIMDDKSGSMRIVFTNYSLSPDAATTDIDIEIKTPDVSQSWGGRLRRIK